MDHTHTQAVASHLDLLGFLTLGLLGGFGHCVGMCSPFVLMVSRRYAGEARPSWLAQTWYNAGRITTYMLLGTAAGAMGLAVGAAGEMVGLRQAAWILAGVMLVVWSLAVLTDVGSRLLSTTWLSRIVSRLSARMPSHPFTLGLALGLLPCGLVYTAVVGAIAQGSLVDGALALAAFGAGTVPALLALSFADDLIVKGRPLLNRLSQVFVLVMGVMFLLRGFKSF
jgi:sulfite exporter TauE/SafE